MLECVPRLQSLQICVMHCSTDLSNMNLDSRETPIALQQSVFESVPAAKFM